MLYIYGIEFRRGVQLQYKSLSMGYDYFLIVGTLLSRFVHSFPVCGGVSVGHTMVPLGSHLVFGKKIACCIVYTQKWT